MDEEPIQTPDEAPEDMPEETPEEAPEEAQIESPSALRTLAQLYQISPRAMLWITVVIAGLVCFGVVKAIEAGRRSAEKSDAEQASWQLFGSKSPQQLDSLIATFPSSELIPIATLKLAQAHFYQGNMQAAFSGFDKFVKEHVDHPLFFAAWMGKIVCLETTGKKEQIEAALLEYSMFVSRPAPTGPTAEQQAEQILIRNTLATEAQFGRGRCLEQLGRMEEAKQVYSQLAVAKSPVWIDRAEQSVARIDIELKRKAGTL